MKKIALLRSYPKEATLGKIAMALSREYHVDCFIWDRQGDYQPIAVNGNITYRRCDIRAGYYSIGTLLKLCLFEAWLFPRLLFTKLDCIHALDLDTGLVGLCVARLRGKPFVYQCLDPYYTVLPAGWPKFLAKIAKCLENYVISRADLFVITDLLRMPQHQGARPKRVVEFANIPIADLSRYGEMKHEGYVIGYIGSLAEGRNLFTTIEAAGELRDKGVKLVIGGFGPLAEKVGEACRKYDNVMYMSWVPAERLFELESGFDAFVYVTDRSHAAHQWVSPNKLFESMAFGKPIIVGEGTLSAKRVSITGNGVATAYGSTEALKKAILALKENPGMAHAMGARGRAEFEHNWKKDMMEKRLLEAYAALDRDEVRPERSSGTEKDDYTERLVRLETGWKRLLDVQRPYRRHLQRLRLGFVLDIGCGLGRNLINLGGRDAGVGIDHNPRSMAVARSRGLLAFTPEEFRESAYAVEGRFDTVILSHVAEHMMTNEVVDLLRDYLVYLRPGGKVVIITPQERGFRSDPTHRTFIDFTESAALALKAGLEIEKQYSFPFPRVAGRFFTHNEFVTLCRKPDRE
jgi:glycosyltransferase involved in cell wall biosynthesis/SAM-dependent methyltransferase